MAQIVDIFAKTTPICDLVMDYADDYTRETSRTHPEKDKNAQIKESPPDKKRCKLTTFQFDLTDFNGLALNNFNLFEHIRKETPPF